MSDGGSQGKALKGEGREERGDDRDDMLFAGKKEVGQDADCLAGGGAHQTLDADAKYRVSGHSGASVGPMPPQTVRRLAEGAEIGALWHLGYARRCIAQYFVYRAAEFGNLLNAILIGSWSSQEDALGIWAGEKLCRFPTKQRSYGASSPEGRL